MTGRLFKVWAERIPDNAVVEIRDRLYADWKALEPLHIRAILAPDVLPQPTKEEHDDRQLLA